MKHTTHSSTPTHNTQHRDAQSHTRNSTGRKSCMPRRSRSCPNWQGFCFFVLLCSSVIAFVLPSSSSSPSWTSRPLAAAVAARQAQTAAAAEAGQRAGSGRPRFTPLFAVSDPVEHLKEVARRLAGKTKQSTMPSSSSPSTPSPRLLLASGGFRDETRIQFLSDELRAFFGEGVSELLFIPFGAKDYDACVRLHETSGMAGGYKLRSIHKEKDPLAAIKRAQGIYVCGGNVFRLLRELRRRGLLEAMREAVMEEGIPYLGVSAGTVLACPTICTSNDMPIVDPGAEAGEAAAASSSSALSALGLVDFQINAHFYGGDFYSQEPGTGEFQVHFGMNREERIKEFLEEVSEDAPVTVLGLAEGYILKCEGGKVGLLGGPSTRGSPLTIFRKHHAPLEVEGIGGEDLSPLFRRKAGGREAIVPLGTLFGNPVKSQARLSPDGHFLSYLAPDPKTDVLNVWVVERRHGVDSGEARMVTHDAKRGVRQHFWAENSRDVLYMQDVGGDENWHLYTVRVGAAGEGGTGGATPTVRDLTPFEGVRAQNVILSKKRPDELLVGLNVRDRAVFDVYRVQLSTGACVLDTQNPGDVLSWYTDLDFEVRGAYAADAAEGGRTLRVREKGESEWRTIQTWGFEETSGVVGFNAEGDGIYVVSSLGSDTTRLVELDGKDGNERRTLVHDPRCDVGDVMLNKETHVVEAVEFNYEISEWRVMEGEAGEGSGRSLAKDFAAIEAAVTKEEGSRREFSVVARGQEDSVWVVAVTGDTVPTAYYLYYRATQALDLLFVDRPDLLRYSLGMVRPVIIPASDGEQLVSYLTLPPPVDPSWAPGLDSLSLDLPLVLLVHGGPWARDSWGFNPVAQLLASRGYAVLQVNYRGSAGFGKSFINKGNGEWGVGTMQRDLTESVDWAVNWGVADRKRVAIMGGSYGGYATLAGLCFTPEVYSCGVDIVGPAHIKTLFESIPPYWAPMKRQLVKRVGDVEEDEELNQRISPVFHAKNIQAPLMIVQGSNDPRVKKAESDQMVASMRAEGLEVCYLVYPDEGHGLARPPNKMDMYNRVEAFLAKHLGGGVFVNEADKKLFDGNTAVIE